MTLNLLVQYNNILFYLFLQDSKTETALAKHTQAIFLILLLHYSLLLSEFYFTFEMPASDKLRFLPHAATSCFNIHFQEQYVKIIKNVLLLAYLVEE